MDLPDADLTRLIRTIRQFKLLNMLFSSSRILIKRHFFSIMEQCPGQTYSLLDIGAGGCDIAVWAAKEARRRKILLNITALDTDKRIIPSAAAAIKNYPEIKLVHASAMDLAQMGQFDFIFSNHFLHHLEWKEIEDVVKLVRIHTVRAFIMNDLKRSQWAYLGYTIFAGLFMHNSLAFYDGRLSIRKGFLENELRALVNEKLSGLGIEVLKVLPARIYLAFRTPTARV